MRSDTRVSRRRFIGAGGAVALGVMSGPLARASSARSRVPDGLFRLGVASGTPTAGGVVLWTRLAPAPHAADGGMPARSVTIHWQVAHDERFRRIVARGTEQARPALAHSVHAQVRGLRPGREYWFRFLAGRESSPVGRTKTLASGHGGALAFAFASCQRFEHGYFTAYRAMAADELDLVVHLGDYIYENAIPPAVTATAPRAGAVPDAVRPEATDLAGYRLRHALYKTDPDLQTVHARFPWAVILDNHDAVGRRRRRPAAEPDRPRWKGGGTGKFEGIELSSHTPRSLPLSARSCLTLRGLPCPATSLARGRLPRNTLARRAAAYQAWWEHMPVPPRDAPQGPAMPIHRRLAIGDLLDLHLLDTRQFRADEDACAAPPPNIGPRCEPVLAERRSMLGAHQERWLRAGLRASRARWTAIAQTVLMAQYDFQPGAGESFYLSGWDGYPAARRRLLDAVVGSRVRNPVVLSGDWHTQWVNDLALDPEDDRSPVVATELVGTAISSDPAFTSSRSAPALGENPHVKYYSDRNGYTRARLDHSEWRSDFVSVDAKRPDGRAEVAASHVVEDGRPGAV